MKKRIVIELDSNWVLAHQEDEKLPIERMKSALQTDPFSVEDSSLSTLTLLMDGDWEDKQTAERIEQIFCSLYPQENVHAVMDVEILPIAENPTNEEPAKRDAKKGKERRVPSPGLKKLMKDVHDLVGCEEFKQLIEEIVKVAPLIVKKESFSLFSSRSYLFSIGDGCGLTTYLHVLAKAVQLTGLSGGKDVTVFEVPSGVDKDDPDPFKEVQGLVGNSSSLSRFGILCVDISEWMGKTESMHFRNMMRAIEKRADRFVVVFRVPFLERNVLDNLNFALNDLMSVRTITFPPFDHKDLETCARRELKQYGYRMDEGAWDGFHLRISEEKRDGKFYGLNTVKKVVRELVYNKLLQAAQGKKSAAVICDEDMKTICTMPGGDLSAEAELNALVGIEQVKAQIAEIVAQIQYSIRTGSSDRPCIHMCFVGNPGTGKTTVARILGKMLKDKGVLRIGNLFECRGRDLCGRYVGETAPKTTSICRDAYGSVLFIDEAYSLYRGDDTSVNDYGREAIDTLIAEMENHRDDFVVILAGYTDDMETMMQGNRGLASRVPYCIEFPNFTREELYGIFVSMVKKQFPWDDALMEAAHAYFLGLSDAVIGSKEFSNARFVRNLFERTCAKAVMRCQLAGEREVALTKDDFERASSEREFANNIRRQSRIGFQ